MTKLKPLKDIWVCLEHTFKGRLGIYKQIECVH